MSTLKVNKIEDVSGNEKFTADAWVNFIGVDTVTIVGAGNVSSITDDGVGDYEINFETPMSNTNFATVGSVTGIPNTSFTMAEITASPSVNHVGVSVGLTNTTTTYLADGGNIMVIIHGGR